MALSLVTGPAIEPVSLADAKTHLRVEVDDENALIQTLISAARQWVETFTHRALITQTWDLKLDGFLCGSDDAIELPLAPASSVTSIAYVDSNGDTQTWASANYTTDLPSGPKAQRGRIVPAYSMFYPSTRDVVNAVTVRFVAGYGSTAASVPQPIVAAIKLMVAHWYAQREPVNIGNLVTPIPMATESLLWPYKAF